MLRTRTKKLIMIALVLASLVVVISASYLLLKKDKQDSTEPPNTYKYDLVILEPFDLRLVNINDEIKIAVINSMDNPETSPNAVEIVLKYDPDIFHLEDISPNTDLLSLNDHIDNSLGTATVDMTTSHGNGFLRGQQLALFTFKLIRSNVSTQINLNEESTYGSPDQLDYENSITNLNFTFSDEKPTQEN